MIAAGNLSKMRTKFGAPIQYSLQLEQDNLQVNELIGNTISIQFSGRINCVSCGKITRKSFGQGFCYNCFMSAPDNSPCIIRPELCEAHLGKGRDVQWELDHHMQPHTVYLALSSGVKVGVTRDTQVPTRWIDQGAWKAIKLAEVPYRQLAGEIEVMLKESYSDKTNWQQMLKNVRDKSIDLMDVKHEASMLLPDEFQDFIADDDTIFEMDFPVLKYPEKVKSITLEKVPHYTGKLMGIKAQYLIFEDGYVFNVRNHSGYWVEISA